MPRGRPRIYTEEERSERAKQQRQAWRAKTERHQVELRSPTLEKLQQVKALLAERSDTFTGTKATYSTASVIDVLASIYLASHPSRNVS